MITALKLEYLERPLIENMKYLIKENEIKISCDHTCFINTRKINQNFTKEEIMQLYSDVYRLAKNQNVNIGRKNGYKKFINENFKDYETTFKYYSLLFCKLIELSREVKERGIHRGTCDDTVLNKLTDTRNKYEEVFWRDSIYSKMNDVYRQLQKYYEDLTRESQGWKLSKIYL